MWSVLDITGAMCASAFAGMDSVQVWREKQTSDLLHMW